MLEHVCEIKQTGKQNKKTCMIITEQLFLLKKKTTTTINMTLYCGFTVVRMWLTNLSLLPLFLKKQNFGIYELRMPS